MQISHILKKKTNLRQDQLPQHDSWVIGQWRRPSENQIKMCTLMHRWKVEDEGFFVFKRKRKSCLALSIARSYLELSPTCNTIGQHVSPWWILLVVVLPLHSGLQALLGFSSQLKSDKNYFSSEMYWSPRFRETFIWFWLGKKQYLLFISTYPREVLNRHTPK